MARLLSALLLTSLFIVAAPARAFTPESGWWWNPDQPGIGFSIEIQDDFVFMVAFAYNQGGGATWYAAQGEMADNAFFSAPLYRRDNGTCLGCPFVPPSNTYAVGQNVAIEFDTETTGVMTWAGRTIPIERQDYYLSRTPGIDPKTELWLGEWQVVMDFYDVDGGDFQDYPFLGDVFVFDFLDTGSNPDFVEGCRPEDSLVGVCDGFALENHDVAGYYSAPDGTNIIVVNDSANGWFVYEVEVGLYQFDGYMKSCPKSLTNLITQCLDNNATYPVIPVRGWRSASRAYIEGDDDAPNAVGDAPKSTRDAGSARVSTAARLFTPKAGAVVPPARQRPDVARSSAMMEALIAKMQAGERKSSH
jgi:hypothetical protein